MIPAVPGKSMAAEDPRDRLRLTQLDNAIDKAEETAECTTFEEWCRQTRYDPETRSYGKTETS